MREFTSYGPVNLRKHYGAPRLELISQCAAQLVGDPDDPEDSGHFFTIWAPRQTGKTWLMRRATAQIQAQYGDRFVVAKLSAQGLLNENDPPEKFLHVWPGMVHEALRFEPPVPADFDALRRQFSREGGIFERPLLLFVDEFDSLPAAAIDQVVSVFRKIYLSRESYQLHGLALIGVRAVLGVGSQSGSPFNVQRSLHVPNLTRDEVVGMFREYQEESGQQVAPQVVDTLYEMTRGQPGLIGWFGELLTQRYNPRPASIDMHTWARVYAAACQVEPNNTMLNLLKKATGAHLPHVLEIFSNTDVPFSFGQTWCNYLYLNGIIDHHETVGKNGAPLNVCRFSSPFVQQRLFNDLSGDSIATTRDLPLDPLDTLADVFTKAGLDVPALLGRYVAYLARLAAKGDDPWKDQPRRSDLHHTEAVGHFHLYRWLCTAVGDQCVVSPEFPTGNGTVDLVLRWQGHHGVIEVKSFVNRSLLDKGQEQAAGYAVKLGVAAATVAVFVPVTDEHVLQALSGQRVIGGVTVTTIAIAWNP